MSEAGARRLLRPLAGKRVIDLSQFIAGPSAAMYLADFGAEVVKVEAPHGDGSRTLSGNAFGSYYTRSFNCGKESRVLDLRDAAQRRRLDDWLAEADGFICNLTPASLKSLGLDASTLRAKFPTLVVALISGYGQDDPRPCMDTVAQCESGFALLNADQDGSPRLATGWPVDTACGLVAGMSCAIALLDPQGGGCVIDISMMEVAASLLMGPATLALSEGATLGPPMGNRDRASAPSNIYRCRDGHVYILGGLDTYWLRLKPLVGCDDDATIAERIARALAGGEHVPTFPALLDGQRLPRQATPAVGGARRLS
jgi:crotonobetainyl-CoA:carnitine CoA-transferase CaiB-like acyl-CoA transferase